MGFFQVYFGTAEMRVKSITFLILSILMTVFIITQIVKVAESNATPLFATVFEETLFPSEKFPQIAICPSSFNESTPAVITNVECQYWSHGVATLITDQILSNFNINGNSLKCYTVNGKQGYTASNYTDMIRCSVETLNNTNIIITYFDNNSPASTNWFDWNVLPFGQDSAIGIVKWFFNGQDIGYQVQTIEDEYRFNQPNFGILFTTEFDFLGEAVYGQVPTYDFWTSLGVVGGYSFLAVQLYTFVVWVASLVFKAGENAQNKRPDSSEYGSL